MRRFCYFILLACAFSFAHAQTALPAFWSFANPSPTDDPASAPNGWSTKLNVVVTGTTPYTYATGSDATPACRMDGTGEYVQIWFAEKPGALSYYIKGTAISPNPPFSGSFKIQESVDGTNWTDVHVLTSMSGSFTRNVETLNSASRYVRFFYADKQSGSNVALDSVYLAKPVAGAAPTINVKQGTSVLANGTTFVVGNAASKVFWIKNSGTAQSLAITSIAISGADATDYTVTNAPTLIAANDSASFTLNFNPASSGSSFAKMTINSNDADNAAFEVNLYGIGGNYATEPTVQPSALNMTNVKAFTFNVGFTEPGTKPEGYIVLRKKGAAITEAPADGQSYLRGDYIGAAQVAYIGSGNSFKPTYIVANANYYFAVFAYNGPKGYENYLTANPLKGSVSTPNGNPGTYYAGINSTASNFVTALTQRIAPHDTIFYGNYTPTMINNFVTRDTTGGRKVVNCVYTGIPYIYEEPFVWWGNGTGGTLTREHSYAQSWMPSRSAPNWPNGPNGREFQEYDDQHHLFPADQIQGNNVRSNNPFGEVVTITAQNGEGKIGKDANGKTVYEPRDGHKGDVARALFYMCTSYNGTNGLNWSLPASQDQEVLKKWHFQDLPDAWEIARHEYVASLQHNRNPFIDSVNFACRIDFSNMSWIANPASSCGIVVPTLAITSPAGGENWLTGESHAITWTSSNVDSVKIEYSTDTIAYQLVTASAPAAAGTYSWTIPNANTTIARVKITQLNNGNPAVAMSQLFTINNTTGIRDVNPETLVQVYPNPSNGTFTLRSSELLNGHCRIMDATGKLVMQLPLNQAETAVKLDHQGVYILQLVTPSKTWYKKLVVE